MMNTSESLQSPGSASHIISYLWNCIAYNTHWNFSKTLFFFFAQHPSLSVDNNKNSLSAEIKRNLKAILNESEHGLCTHSPLQVQGLDLIYIWKFATQQWY